MRNCLRIFTLICLLLVSTMTFATINPDAPKREFRGAWIQAVNGQFLGMNEFEMKNYLREILDELKKANINAIIFQVRVEGDALSP